MKPPARTVERTRWVWLWLQDGARVLAFTYVDPSAGPSARGAMVGTPPSPEDVRRAVDHPDRTVREPRQFKAMPLRAEELLRLGLPREPPWLGHFEPRPIPPPRGEPSRTVTARVVLDGSPVAGVRVRMGKLFGPDLIRLDERRSDDAGRVEFPLAPVGEVTLIADIVSASSRLITSSADEFELVLARTGVITGEVSRAGEPAAAQISVFGRDGEPYRLVSTRPAGRYVLPDVVPGRYEIRAIALDEGHMTNGAPVVAEITVGEAETVLRDFTLAAGAVVHVVVHLPDDHTSGHVYLLTGAAEPVVDTELRPLFRTPALRSANSLSTRDRRMTTEFRDVGPGTYTVCVAPWDRHGSGSAEQPVASERIFVGADAQTVELALPPLRARE